MNNKVRILTSANLIYFTLCVALFLLFLFLANFSLPAIFLCLVALGGGYWFFYKNRKELLAYCLVIASFFSLFYLGNIARWPVFLLVVFFLPISFLISRFLLVKKIKQLENLYALIMVLILGELALGILPLNLPIIVKALIGCGAFYLFGGLLNLNLGGQLAFKSIFAHGAIFSAIMIIVIYVVKI